MGKLIYGRCQEREEMNAGEWKLVFGSAVAFFLIGCAASNQPTGNFAAQQAVQIDRGPKPLPAYPMIAFKNRWQGLVTLRVVVTSDCRASSIEVIQSTGHGVLDDEAKKAVSNWTFQPNEVGTNTVPIKFTLPDDFTKSN